MAGKEDCLCATKLKKLPHDWRQWPCVATRLNLESVDAGDPPAEIWGGLRRQGLGKCGSLDKPLITVAVATMNAKEKLQKCILSVLAQSYDCVELCIWDGDSTDGTRELLEAWSESIDCWVSAPDGGVYDAMNKLSQIARGQWILFLGSDDELLDSLEVVATYLRHEHCVYYGDVYMVGKASRYAGSFNTWKLALKNICHQSIFYPRKVFEQEVYELRYAILADHALNLKLWGAWVFEWMPVVVSRYDDKEGLSSLNADTVFQGERCSLVRRYFPRWIYWLFMIRRVLATLVRSVFDQGR